MSAKRTRLSPRAWRARKLLVESLESRVLLSGHPVLTSLAAGAPAAANSAIVGLAAPFGAQNNSGRGAADDYGNTIGTAYALTLDATGHALANGKINDVGDVDMFALLAGGAGQMSATLTAPSGKNGAIPQLTLYDASGNALASGAGSSKSRTASASPTWWRAAPTISGSPG
jgi:hypothetical protein